jgi:two-component system, cell cycle sensor histidine kinase and response regulator CckA
MSKEELLKALHVFSQRGQVESDFTKQLNLQSLEAYVSGIAHEYNNLLTAIIGNLSLAKMYAKPGYEVFDVLSEAEKASFRAKELTNQLLIFVQGSSPENKVTCLKDSLEHRISGALSDSRVKLELSITEDLWPVETDELQLKRAIDYSVTNARDSLSEGGVLRVKCENIELLTSLSGTPLTKGKYVLVSICGAEPGIHANKPGEMTDMHAAVMKGGCVKSDFSSGSGKQEIFIFERSFPGGSTISNLYIPIRFRPHSSEEAGKTFPYGKGRILVMDDEEIVRLVVSKLLNQCGYEAEVVRGGEEMLSSYETARLADNPFDAVILDLGVKGGMGGEEAIRHLLEVDPHAKAIVSSGFAYAPVMSSFREFGFVGFLAKPYRLEELGRVLNAVLNDKGQ